MFTDTEIGLKMGYDRKVNALAAEAQGAINHQAGEIAMLTKALQDARAELRVERARRIAAELRIEEILDTPI